MKSAQILLCAALLLTGSLWLADSAMAKPAYCYCDYCSQAGPNDTCTDPLNHNVYNYQDWCWYNCLDEPEFFTSASSLQTLDTDVDCQPVQTPAEDTLKLEPQPSL